MKTILTLFLAGSVFTTMGAMVLLGIYVAIITSDDRLKAVDAKIQLWYANNKPKSERVLMGSTVGIVLLGGLLTAIIGG